MKIAPEWTTDNIKAQLKLAREDLFAEQRVIDTLTDRRDIVAAYARVRDLMDTITLFEQRLEAVEKREAEKVRVQAETRARCEQERDAATEEHNRLDEVFESDMQPLEALILDYLDRLDQTAMQRGRAESRRSTAAFELNGRRAFGDSGELSTGNGWFSTANPNARSDVRRVLFELYAARRHLHGLLQLDGQDDGYRGVFGIAPRPQELTQPDPNDAFREQVVAEFAAKG